MVIVILLFSFMLSTDRSSDIMLEVRETGPGEYKVSLSLMHLDWIINCASRTAVSTEAVLALWLGTGMNSMAELCKPTTAHSPVSGEPPGG